MIKKKTSRQTIAIIILAILLILSIVFGSTYSYFNASTKDAIEGTVTTATLSVSLKGYDETLAETTTFSLHTSGTKVIPGEPLTNTALQINNTSPVPTYMCVTYKLSIVNGNEDGEVDTSVLNAMDIQESSVGDGWRKCDFTCKDLETKICSFIYLGGAHGDGNGIFNDPYNPDNTTSMVFGHSSLRVPTSWGNSMQGKTIKLGFQAYVIQATALNTKYPDIANENLSASNRASAILSMFVAEFNLDETTAPVD